MKFSASFLAALVAARQVGATGWDINALTYRSPANLDNKCTDAQQHGYDFGDLDADTDEPIGSYGGNEFSGFTCKEGLQKRSDGSQSKYIAGQIDSQGGPSFGGIENSISQMHISSDEDTDVEAHYEMPNGDVCKQTVKCKQGGTDVKNRQCGGATRVSFKQPSTATKSCGLNIHTISFDCKSKSSTVPPSSYGTPAVPSTSASTTPVSESPETTSEVTQSVSSTTISLSSYTLPPVYSTPEVTTTADTYSAPPSPVLNFPSSNSTTAQSTLATSTSAVGTPSAYLSTTASTAAYNNLTTTSSTGLDSYGSTSASTSTTSCPPSSSASASPSPLPPAPAPAPCPNIVQRCLNTWMFETSCSNNAQADCYCRDAQFIAHVHECIGAWGSDCAAKSEAASYLVGICSAHLSTNPALVTALPSCACLGPKPTSTPLPPVAQYPNATSTTSRSDSTSVPATPTVTDQPHITDCPVTTIPYSSVLTQTTDSSTLVTTIITTITIPQVTFYTSPAASSGATPSVGLYVPPSATATATAVIVPSSTSTPAAAPVVPTGTSIVTSVPPTTPTTASPTKYTGAASGKLGISFAAAGAGVLAFLL